MTKPVKRLLFWMPRILCILFAVFVSLFAFDVFGAEYSFWKTILALLIHLIPTGIILVVLAVSWRWLQAFPWYVLRSMWTKTTRNTVPLNPGCL